MKKITSLFLIILMILSVFFGFLSFPPELVEAQGLAETPWPCYRGEAQRTGLSSYNTNYVDGTVKWSYTTGGWVFSSPIIGIDDTIYFGSNDNNFYALYPNGTLKWFYTVGDKVLSSAAIDSNGTIYFGSYDYNLYALYSNGTLKWTFPTGNWIMSSPIIDNNGNVYFGSHDDKLYALYPNGTLKWSYSAGGDVFSSPVIYNEDTIYFGSIGAIDKMYALYLNGTLKWSYNTGSGISSSPAIDSSGNIYFGSNDNNLYALYPNGSLKWDYTTGENIQSSPAIDSDNIIYFGSYDNNLYALYPNGTLKWSFPTGDDVISSPSIGSEGTIYFGSNDNNFYALYPNGTLKWSHTTGDWVYSSPAIGSDSKIYVGSKDNNLYAFGSTIETPSEPQNLTATAGNSYIELTWDPPSDDGGSSMTNYSIYKGETSGGETFLIEIGNVTYYNDTSVTNGITYYYKVSAKNVIAEGLLSNEVEGTPLGPPSAPQNLQSTSGDSWVNITWEVPSNDGGTAITNFRVYKGTVSGSEDFLVEIGIVTHYNDTDVSNGITYYYKITAKNAVGEGPLSIGTEGIPVRLPSEPQNLQAIIGDSYLNLTWDAPSNNGGSEITNYRIFRDGAFLIEIGNVTFYNNTGLTNGQSYSYNVSANNAVGEGPLSTGVSATPATVPTAPQNLQVTAGDGQVVLVWDASISDSSAPITNYRIYRGTTTDDLNLLTTLGNVLTYTDTNVTNGQMYYYKVSAVNIVGEGTQSGEASATPESVTTDGDGALLVMLIALLAIVALIVIIILVAMMKKKKPGEEVPKEEETSSEESPPEG